MISIVMMFGDEADAKSHNCKCSTVVQDRRREEGRKIKDEMKGIPQPVQFTVTDRWERKSKKLFAIE